MVDPRLAELLFAMVAGGPSQKRFERTGFGYAHYAGQTNYGVSFAHPSWVPQQISAIPELRLVHCGERQWANQHDVYDCVRDPEWSVHEQSPVPLVDRVKHWVRDLVATGV